MQRQNTTHRSHSIPRTARRVVLSALLASCLANTSQAQLPGYTAPPNYGSPPSGFAPVPNGQVGSPYTPIPNGVAPVPQPTVNPASPSDFYVPQSGVPTNNPNNGLAQPYANVPPQAVYPPAGYPNTAGPYQGSPEPIAAQPMYRSNNAAPSTINNNYPLTAPGPMNQPLPPLNQPWQLEPNTAFMQEAPFGYNPRIRDVPVDVYVQEGQTGRFSIGGSVNSDLGVAGQVILEERNFDIRAWPNSQAGLLNGAFRGAGQNFRVELMPGNQVQRYTLNWTEPNLFGYSPFSLSVGGFYFTRMFRDWTEQRLGGRVAIGYEVTPDLSLSTELRGEDVKISDPSTNTLPALNRVLGSNDLYTGRVRLAHNTRDSPFLPTEGHLLELIYDQTFGEFDYPRGQVNYSKYFLVRERADQTGRHTFTTAFRFGVTGTDTPLFENFFAGGYSTMRGFQFRGAGPVDQGVQVGGRFQFLGTLEYMMPITADDMLRMVAFVDYGTVERDIELNWDNFRVAPGFGFRVAIPALGPAPLAFDFAFPVAYSDDDSRQVFSFSMGLVK